MPAVTDEVEALQMQLVACSVAASGWCKEPPKRGDWAWSVALDDVMELRRKYEDLLATMGGKR